MPTRHFVTVGERQVHYRRTGSGPAVVVLHESPLSSRAYIPLAEVLAADFTVLLLDNPGFGSSDPLPQESPEIEDFTDALVATLDALGIESAAFYGAHTGACIALDLAHRYPERVAVSVLDGLPYFTDEQRELMLREYTPAIEPRWDGTHLLAAFNQRRDMKLFFPWFSKTAEGRQAITMPPDAQLHAEALDLVKAKDHYAKGYKAAFRYRVREPLAAVTVPVAITARGDEILGAPQADGASATVRTELLPTPRDEWAAALHRIFRESPHAPVPPATPLTGFIPGKLVRLYMEAPHGQLLVRSQHDLPGRPLVMLQPSPFSGAILAPLAAELARTRPVLLLDTPGYGDSDRLPDVEEPSIGDFADGILGALDCLEEFDLYGTLTGSAIAAEIALRAPGRVRSLVLETPPLFDRELRRELYEQMTPVMPEPSGDGGLFVWAWGFARDHAMWFPHYRKSPEFARPGPPITPDQIHLRAVELLKTGSTYRTGPRAAFSYDFEGRLPQLAVRTLVSSHAAATAYRHLREAAALVPGSVLREHDGPVASQAAVVAAFLDEAR
jgi:pimeloyl-ACP methyl ester carboxylesterase